jgi:RNA polymerase sigma factor (sigma-70 family)
MTAHGARHDSGGDLESDVSQAADDVLLSLIGAKENGERARTAWGTFYSRHIEFLHALCVRTYGKTLGHDGAENLVADTFLRVFTNGAETYRGLNSYDPDAQRLNVRGWLISIAHNIACDMLRGRRNAIGTQLQQEQWQHQCASLDQPVSKTTKRICELMGSILGEREEDVLRTTFHWHDAMKKHQKLPAPVLADLASRWKTTPENIRQIRSRALTKLKAALEADVAQPPDKR